MFLEDNSLKKERGGIKMTLPLSFFTDILSATFRMATIFTCQTAFLIN